MNRTQQLTAGSLRIAVCATETQAAPELSENSFDMVMTVPL